MSFEPLCQHSARSLPEATEGGPWGRQDRLRSKTRRITKVGRDTWRSLVQAPAQSSSSCIPLLASLFSRV